MINELINPFNNTVTEPQNIAVVPVVEKTVKYNLTSPKSDKKVNVCLIGGVLTNTILTGRVVTDKAFKAVDSENEITVKSLESDVTLQHRQAFDLLASPFVKEIRIKPVTEQNQIKQGSDNNLIISILDNTGVPISREIKGLFDNEKHVWIYPVGEQMTFNKAVYYSLLSEISVDVEVVY